ncbi:MAG: hypothetical protein WBA46_11525 [Thermomicrobiales bacterium]
MRKHMLIAPFVAALLIMSAFTQAMADTSTNVTLTITGGTQLSVAITGSNNFPNQPFSLTNAPGNYTYSAYYNLQVIDGRGTGAGWNVTGSATPFTQVGTGAPVPGSGLPSANNHCNGNYGGPEFCAAPGSISNGVAVVAGSPDLIAGPGSLIVGHAGQAPGPLPNATGTFDTQEAVYYTGFPAGIQAGTYTTTITLSISGSNP